jgi:ssDNA-specific exonuclease RecJ
MEIIRSYKKTLHDTIKQCDQLRQDLEGVGLSDGLIEVVILAYSAGKKKGIDQVTAYYENQGGYGDHMAEITQALESQSEVKS